MAKLLKIQRIFLLQITKAARSTSNEALQAITGIPPIDFTIRAKLNLFHLKIGFRGAPFTFDSPTPYTDNPPPQDRIPILLAIKEAVISILDHRENSQNIMINSDSQAALRFISNPVARNRLALDIRQLLGEHPDVDICFRWVRGHSGIQGNEEADLAAKGAALSSIPHSFNYAPLSYFKGKVRQELVLSWNSRWSSVAKGAATGRFIPDIGRTYRKRPLTLNTTVIQYLTGHGNFNQYLHRIRKSETFNCFCGAVDNPLHRLKTCPGTIRLTNAFRIRHNIGTSYYCDLIKDNCYQDFLSLCNAVNQFYTIRAGRSLNNPTSNATTIPFSSSHQLADR